ncbi:MAG: hypothetical protein LBS90_02225 [Oscillospiraceae bacterium]|nr:hypothetical protein [Oscillospiraceae bacterium]
MHELIDYEQFCGLNPPAGETPVSTLTPLELKARIDAGDKLRIVDIREGHERAIAKFANSVAIPLGQIARRIDEFDPATDTVFLCKIGKRSIYAIRALEKAGYTGRMFNLQDGVNGWARDVDASLPQY